MQGDISVLHVQVNISVLHVQVAREGGGAACGGEFWSEEEVGGDGQTPGAG